MLGQILPIIDAYKANKILREKNRNVSDIKVPDNLEQIDIKYLEDGYKATIEAKNRFEDKAKTIVAALTIAITLILNLSRIIDIVSIKIPIPNFNYVIFLLAILSILYMVIAGIMSIQVLIKENLLYPIPLEKRTDKKIIFRTTQHNINQNLIRNNIIYAAYISIRNSVICLLTIFVLAIYPYNVVDNNMSNIQISNGIELVYGDEAVEWLINNSPQKPDFDRIVESYNNICYDGTKINIYDKSQGIIVTVAFQNNSYIIYKIIDHITEIK